MKKSVSGIKLAALCILITHLLGLSAAVADQSIVLPQTESEQQLKYQDKVLSSKELPAGKVEADGIVFNISPKQVVSMGGAAGRNPVQISLEKASTATHVAFLHTFNPGPALHEFRMQVALAHKLIELPPAPPTVLRYVVNYADGKKETIPVRFGEGIDQWYRVHEVGPMLWSKAAWIKDLKPYSGEKAVLYAMNWPNPRPDTPIVSIAVLANEEARRDYGQGLLAAVTLRKVQPTGRFYYVATPPMGQDSQPGTFEQAFGSLRQAAKVAKAGDTVFVRGGLYAVDEQIVIENSGTPDKWITISSYPGETPRIDARAFRMDLRMKPFTPDGPSGPQAQHDSGVIAAQEQSYIRIQGMEICNSRRAGISAYGKDGKERAHHVDILFNRTSRTFSMGIIAHSVDHIKILGNIVCRPHSLQMAFNEFTGQSETFRKLHQEGIDLTTNEYFEIGYNAVYGGSKEAIDCIKTQKGRVHHNYVHSSMNGIYVDSWNTPITEMEVDHNYIHNAFSGIPFSTEGGGDIRDIKIHHNINFDSKMVGISIGEATYKAKPAAINHVQIYNNTTHHDGYHGNRIRWRSAGIEVSGFDENMNFTDVLVVNNIATDAAHVPLGCGFSDMAAHNIRYENNLSYPAKNRMPAYFPEKDRVRTKMVLGENAVTEAPEYVNAEFGDFRLKAASPAIDAGSNEPFGADPDGSRRDIGALPAGSAWLSGFDWAGNVTMFYHGGIVYEPLEIPRDKFTIHRNHLERPSWFQVGRYGEDFQNLPDGLQSLAGITWDIVPDNGDYRPNVMALEGLGCESTAKSITDIPVARKADVLAFLHAYHSFDKTISKDTQLFHYHVLYADGSSADIPVRWGQEIESWYGGKLASLPNAALAWYQTSRRVARDPKINGEIGLYAFEWTNPSPDKEIKSIDIINDVDPMYGSCAVMAITSGKKVK
jgi:hypothetical protein